MQIDASVGPKKTGGPHVSAHTTGLLAETTGICQGELCGRVRPSDSDSN